MTTTVTTGKHALHTHMIVTTIAPATSRENKAESLGRVYAAAVSK
jgi:hypothetical protein